jgi:hypothetical protein
MISSALHVLREKKRKDNTERLSRYLKPMRMWNEKADPSVFETPLVIGLFKMPIVNVESAIDHHHHPYPPNSEEPATKAILLTCEQCPDCSHPVCTYVLVKEHYVEQIWFRCIPLHIDDPTISSVIRKDLNMAPGTRLIIIDLSTTVNL